MSRLMLDHTLPPDFVLPQECSGALLVKPGKVNAWDRYSTWASQVIQAPQHLVATHCILKNLSFKGVDLRGANFSNATLVDVSFADANLEGAVFDNASIKGASFQGAKLKGSSFQYATITKTCFWDGALEAVNFTHATLVACRFGKGKLLSFNFLNAACHYTHFKKADLEGGVFDGATLASCNFVQSTLTRVSFRETYLLQLFMDHVTGLDVSFDGAHVLGLTTRLSSIDLKGAALEHGSTETEPFDDF